MGGVLARNDDSELSTGRRKRIRGVVIHRSRGLVAEWQPPWHLPRTTVEDTVLDLIATARTFDDAYGWISAAVGRRLTTPELLGKALAGRARMRWRGWVTADVTDHRCRTAAEIAAVLRGQGWAGTLRRCGPSCTATGTQKHQRPQKPQQHHRPQKPQRPQKQQG
jgi:hypothetical protein